MPRKRAGRVVSTAGSHVIILVDSDAAALDCLQMGSLMRVRSPHAPVYGLVEGLSTPIPCQSESERDGELKIAEIGLLGEVPDDGGQAGSVFRRGVSNLPSLDASVFLADQDDTATVYALVGKSSVCIGTIQQDSRVPACINIDDMLAKHFAILGSTGTGRSCAVTLILRRIIEQNPESHILLLDPYGEYGETFGEHLTVSNFRLPYWILNFEEIYELIFGQENRGQEAENGPFRDLVLKAKQSAAPLIGYNSWITVDTPTPYSLSDINRLLDRGIGALDNSADVPVLRRIKVRLAALQSDRRYAWMFDNGLVLKDILGELLGRVFRVPAYGRPIAVLDLANVPSEALNVVVAVICRLAFDFSVAAGQDAPLLLVFEEAHQYAPHDSKQGFDAAKRALLRIAKEGRKYGISLGVVSQRPSDLDATVLSQCITVSAFRMSNERDQEIIKASVSEAAPGVFSSLPFLGNSEALATGEGVSVTMRLRFEQLPEAGRPRSPATFSSRWQSPGENGHEVLDRAVDLLRDGRSGR